MPVPHHDSFIHHKKTPKSSLIREGIFGIEDGLVSTLGSLTGIAAATADFFTIVLSGFVIIAVESISMAAGSFLSSKSERDIEERKLTEEKIELKKYPQEEKEELVGMYVKDGWSQDLAKQMVEEASKNRRLFLQEMAYRELKIFPDQMDSPKDNALVMGFSYLIGGIVPLLPYFIFSTGIAIVISIIGTLVGLFVLGVFTTKYSARVWWKAGVEMLTLAGFAALIGYGVGQIVSNLFGI